MGEHRFCSFFGRRISQVRGRRDVLRLGGGIRCGGAVRLLGQRRKSASGRDQQPEGGPVDIENEFHFHNYKIGQRTIRLKA